MWETSGETDPDIFMSFLQPVSECAYLPTAVTMIVALPSYLFQKQTVIVVMSNHATPMSLEDDCTAQSLSTVRYWFDPPCPFLSRVPDRLHTPTSC